MSEVLLLSATPIPRTLAFALASLRELSVHRNPPVRAAADRDAPGALRRKNRVKTVDTGRTFQGGQVFYVYNKVGDYTFARGLSKKNCFRELGSA